MTGVIEPFPNDDLWGGQGCDKSWEERREAEEGPDLGPEKPGRFKLIGCWYRIWILNTTWHYRDKLPENLRVIQWTRLR